MHVILALIGFEVHTWSALSGWWKTFFILLLLCMRTLIFYSSNATLVLSEIIQGDNILFIFTLCAGFVFYGGTSTHGVVSFQHTALCVVWARKPQNMKGLLVKTLQSGKGVILFCISKWGAAKDQSITEAYCACTCVVVSFTPRHLFNKHTMMMGCPKTLHCLRFRMISTINDYILPMIY